jgi:nucleoside-diphosphate-sugar epimerase
MRIFLTGATGYVGGVVGGALRKAGHEVIGLARTPESGRKLEQNGIIPQRGDLDDPGALAEVAASADTTIHTAFRRDVNAPLADQAFVNAALGRLGSGQTFLYTSGVWVMGNTEKDADEESPLAPPDVVAWRPAVERKVLGAAGRGVRAVVVRPAMVYGRGGGVVAEFFRSARETGAAVVIGNGDNHWSFVHVDDLADLYVRALDARPGSLYVASGEVQRVRDVAAEASRAAGAEGRIRTWPVEEAFRQLGPFVHGLALDQRITSRKAERELRWKANAPAVIEEIRKSGQQA